MSNKQLPTDVELRYNEHKRNAKRRGIGFYYTLEEWWSEWKSNWNERGSGKKMMCRYKDKGDYILGNCYIGTASNNAKEAGVGLNRAKLTEDDVSDIRLLIGSGLTNVVIAEQFNVSDAQISRIKTGERW